MDAEKKNGDFIGAGKSGNLHEEAESTWPSILLIGDSLTQQGYSESGQWVSLLSDLFQRKCDIINRGFSGYTTRSIIPFLPKIISKHQTMKAAVVVVFFGANDSNLEELNKLQHVPLQEYKNNLTEVDMFLHW